MRWRASSIGNATLSSVLCRSIVGDSPVAMALAEGEHHILRHVNPAFCRLTHKKMESLIGNSFAAMIPTDQDCLALLDRVYQTGEPEIHADQGRYEDHDVPRSYAMWRIVAEDKGPPAVMVQVIETTPLHQQTMEMNQALLISSLRQHELTEAAEILNAQLKLEIGRSATAQEALIRAEKLASVGRMAASIAHEINNPLEAVMNTLFLAQNSGELSDSVRGYLQIAEGELKRIAHITQQTLGFYRESSAPATFYVHELLHSVLDLLKAKIKAKRVTIAIQCDEKLQLTGVFGELRQVFSNLVLNSLDALGAGGTVKVRATDRLTSNGYRSVRLTVADNGQGIPTNALPRIFEPFFTTKGSIGTGLGLWVSRQLIEKHAGSLQVRSRTEGAHRGTVFSIVLPPDRMTSSPNLL